ncbi:MAG: type II 3-dehydroquinate dehydratase [Polyangiaceae bacterium]
MGRARTSGTRAAKGESESAARAAAPGMRVLCISGPNLQLLGTREPHLYGGETLAQIHERLVARGRALGVEVDARQSNYEGEIVSWIGEARAAGVHGLLLNAAAYTHTSIAILDALRAVALPCVEVHLSHPEAREPFRRRSRIAPACVGRVSGFRGESYLLGLEGLAGHLRAG